MKEFDFKGLQFLFKKSSSPVAYCALSIRSGTRREDQRFGGIAHLTEHMIFKGTEHKSASCINSYIEKLGGELNAFTTKEEIVIHSTVLKEDIARAIGLLVELAFSPKFQEKELEKEKAVVLDEIITYKDSPADQIFDDFEELLFEGTNLSMPVLGKTRTLKKIGVKELYEHTRTHFTLNNMAFTVVADAPEEKVRELLLKALKKYAPSAMEGDGKISEGLTIPPRMPQVKTFNKVVNRKGHQTHCIIGAQAYPYYEKKRMALILLVNILGGPAANSRLNTILREKNGLVYNVDAAYGQYSDTGIVTIYFGCDRQNYEKCIRLIEGELEKFRVAPMSDRALKAAKKQLLGQLAISSDNSEAQCLSMGKSLLVFREVIGTARMRQMIEEVTASDVMEAAADIFAPEKICKLTYM
ncbi:MAG: insulinase family protein [Bacteroidales bacterium]|nr:insulinase family protein [Bacteroidales bacterium]